jgi:hypothetical protein
MQRSDGLEKVAPRAAMPIRGARQVRTNRGSFVPGNDDFEIFAGNDQRAVPGDVEFAEQGIDVGFKRGARCGVKCFERLDHRAVIVAEDLEPMLRRLVAENAFHCK